MIYGIDSASAETGYSVLELDRNLAIILSQPGIVFKRTQILRQKSDLSKVTQLADGKGMQRNPGLLTSSPPHLIINKCIRKLKQKFNP